MKTKWLPLSENYYTGSTTLLLQDTTNQSKKGYLCITAFSGYTDRLMFINNIFRWPSSTVRHRKLVFSVFLKARAVSRHSGFTCAHTNVSLPASQRAWKNTRKNQVQIKFDEALNIVHKQWFNKYQHKNVSFFLANP